MGIFKFLLMGKIQPEHFDDKRRNVKFFFTPARGDQQFSRTFNCPPSGGSDWEHAPVGLAVVPKES
jgi:hypothetical protein